MLFKCLLLPSLCALRLTRNRIAYNGFFVTDEYLERKMKEIQAIIEKFRVIIYKKL